jgi:hypothetical protein
LMFGSFNQIKRNWGMGRRPRTLLAGGIYHVENWMHRGGLLVRGENEADRVEALLAATKKRAIPTSSG